MIRKGFEIPFDKLLHVNIIIANFIKWRSLRGQLKVKACDGYGQGHYRIEGVLNVKSKSVWTLFSQQQSLLTLVISIDNDHVLDWGKFDLSSKIQCINFLVRDPLGFFVYVFVYFSKCSIGLNCVKILQIFILVIIAFQLTISEAFIFYINFYLSSSHLTATPFRVVADSCLQLSSLHIWANSWNHIEDTACEITLNLTQEQLWVLCKLILIKRNVVMRTQVEGHFLTRKQVLAVISLNIVVKITKFCASSISCYCSFKTFIKTNWLINETSPLFYVVFKNSKFSISQNNHSLLFFSQLLQVIICLEGIYLLFLPTQDLIHRFQVSQPFFTHRAQRINHTPGWQIISWCM